MMSPMAFADDLIRFDIDKQRADKAIIAFATKTDQTVIFSFDLAKKHQANALKGYYSVTSGLEKLLNGSGLIAVVNNSGQLSIQVDTNNERITTMKNKTMKAALVPIVIGAASQTALAQEPAQEQEIEQISIIGSRVSSRSADELPVPVDILSAEALANTGQTEVGRMLQAIAPSFNFSSSSISDGTDALRPATLRGLGPDQTLVLINGKRRHQASLIHINTSVGRGTAGTDMNAIPASSIKRIEVLRDGAAAQYGSDAIAGVINIVLNDASEGGKVAVSYGEYSEGDGETTNVDISKGFSLGENGYLNATLNFRDRGVTNRAGLHGSCQFSGCTELANGDMLLGDPREATAPRTTFRIGDADSQQVGLAINTGYQLGEGELYGFITYSKRDNQSAAFFRHNANAGGNAQLQDGDATIPAGFLPKINSDIKDVSYNFGYQVDFSNDASLDFSYTYGQNNIDYTTSDTINSSFANSLQYTTSMSANDIRNSVPREAFAYGLELTLQTLNLDYTKEFDLFSLAMGAEIRTDEYRVTPGDEYSYRDYDTENGNSLFATDTSAGSQGFGGIGPVSEVDETRDVISFYVDAETEITEDLIISGAIRYDDYDGFGDSSNFKLAANWSITEDIAIRGATSTGFRAPSMQQLYFNNISTQFITNPDDPAGDQIAVQVGTFRNDSVLAQAIGIPELKEEEATNFSFGTVIQVADNINLTVDWYSIDIDDRIVISNKLGSGLSPALDAALIASGAGAGQFFLNGADTETSGVDIIATWNTAVLGGDLDLTFAANFTETEVVNIFTPKDSGLGDIPPEDIFSEQDISIIEEWQPEDRISLSGLYKLGDFTINLALNRYGEYTITDGDSQTYGAEVLTDLRVNYQLTEYLSFNLGGNNIFDVYPDKNEIGNSRTGTIVDGSGNVIVSSPGVFTYSRRSAPFGFNGAFYYAGAEYKF
ncbi:TonB-dependent receptor [Thalassotalea fonticola]|uniref:TonB-dependent receptor n=1 Tax=Thalassotalea fonticola TaxID=3065649 RepID=A0ABZ0GWJ7_9GAMM|nr:TonB-dependent receptor [Colwelliaceae bacterium S1-1]